VSQLPIVIGHRGASGYRPEHTRAAYELAFALGADAVEPDLVASKDGVLVIRHENEISGTTDVGSRPEFADRRTTKTVDGTVHTGWFTEDFTWAELSTLRAIERLPKVRPGNAAFDGAEGILRLADLLAMLDAADRPIGMVAEIKHPTYFAGIGFALDELFAAELVAAGWDDDERLTVECFEETVLHQVREQGIRARLVLLIDAEGAPADQVALHGSSAMPYEAYLTDASLAALAGRVDGISVDKHILLRDNDQLVARAHEVGLTVYTWTLRAENRFLAKKLRSGKSSADLGDWRTEYEQLMRTGVDGVFADQPDLALQARASFWDDESSSRR
jgi:glycerophosphoryl diester phosphodiesterase